MNTEASALADHLRRAFEPDPEKTENTEPPDREVACPETEEHLRFVRGELEAGEAERFAAHSDSCAACRAETALAHTFEATGDEPRAGEDPALESVIAALRRRAVHRDPMALGPTAPQDAEPQDAEPQKATEPASTEPSTEPSTGPWASRRAVWRIVVAASLLLTASVGLRTWNELSPPPLPERVDSGITRGAALVGLEPSGELPTMPSRLRWAPVENAVRYRVTLRAVDDRVLWQTEVREAEAPLPAAVIGLSSNVRYSWQVEALANDSRVLALSDSARFLVRSSGATPGGTGNAIALEAPP